MKKHIMKLLAGATISAFVFLSAVATVSAYSVGSADVGSLDTLLYRAKVNSGDQSEIDWVNSALKTSYTLSDLVKYDNTSAIWNWKATNEDANVFASRLESAPEVFFIKTAARINGNKSDFDHFLFTNNFSTDWAVLNLDNSFGARYDIVSIGKFSHIGELGGNTPVPEPATMMMLGFGMLGFAVYGKRRMNKES